MALMPIMLGVLARLDPSGALAGSHPAFVLVARRGGPLRGRGHQRCLRRLRGHRLVRRDLLLAGLQPLLAGAAAGATACRFVKSPAAGCDAQRSECVALEPANALRWVGGAANICVLIRIEQLREAEDAHIEFTTLLGPR